MPIVVTDWGLFIGRIGSAPTHAFRTFAEAIRRD